MRTPLTPAHAKALTVLLLAIRPDWSQSYTFDAVNRMRNIDDDLERICRVAVRAALSPNIRKPDVLAMQGDHWKARSDEAGDNEPIRAKLHHVCGTFHRPPDPCPGPVVISRRHSDHAKAVKAEIRKPPRPSETKETP